MKKLEKSMWLCHLKVSLYLCLAHVSKYINRLHVGKAPRSSASAAVRNAAGSAGQRFGAFVNASNFAILGGESTHGATFLSDSMPNQINLVSSNRPFNKNRVNTYLQLLSEGKGQFQTSLSILAGKTLFVPHIHLK